MSPKAVPLPNGRTLHGLLYNWGDLNHLLAGMILQVAASYCNLISKSCVLTSFQKCIQSQVYNKNIRQSLLNIILVKQTRFTNMGQHQFKKDIKNLISTYTYLSQTKKKPFSNNTWATKNPKP